MRLFPFLFLLWLGGASAWAGSTVAAYPALPGRPTSDVYAVTVNGAPVWTEKFRTAFDLAKLPQWFTKETYTGVQQEVHIADFAGAGELEVAITLPVNVAKVVIHPLSRGIRAAVDGRRLTFPLHGPDQLYVEVNDLPPLCVFANPPEAARPDPQDPHVRYFGPGVHRPGLITLKSGDTVYLAAGALVYGGLRAAPGASHLRILGRGVLDGNFEFEDMVKLEDCHGVEFNGVTIRHGSGWTNTLVNCTDVTYEGVKILGFGPSSDGIDPLGCRQVVINRCFFRCTDDCIAIKSPGAAQVVEDVLITNNTMVGFACADGVTVGFETNGPAVSGVHVQNCDIVMARGGSRVDGHSAFSIICDGPAQIHDILFEDIRVEDAPVKLFELNVTDGSLYDVNPPGHIRGVVLRNISWAAPAPIVLKGFDREHQVERVRFEHCTIGGKPLKNLLPGVLHVGSFVEGVSVE